MVLLKSTKRNMALFIAAFVLCGVLHVALHSVDFTDSISNIYCIVLALLWALTIQKRVVDDRLRRLILLVASTFMLHSVIQFLRYEIAYGIDFKRYLWYAMYIPMIAQPIICFFIASSIYRGREEPLPRLGLLLIAVGAAIALGIFTNDLHFFFKAFPSGVKDDDGQEVSKWLFYATQAFIYGVYALSLLIILKKNRRYVAAKYRRWAFMPFLFGIAYFAVYSFGFWHTVFKVNFWNMAEAIAFVVSASVEICILSGMIPANTAYEALFAAAKLPAVILDDAGNPVYKTAGAEYPFPESEDAKIVSHPISGGSVEYLVDMTRVNEVNRQLEESAGQIEARNAYIAEESRIKKELAELETRNRLYDSISGIVAPQLDRIDAMLNAPQGCGMKELARIAVLKAYIKRRSNMELLAAGGGLTVTELASAVVEELDYLRLCGVNTASSALGTGVYPAEMIASAYEHIEAIIEESLDSLSDMIVALRASGDSLSVRIMLRSDSFSYKTGGTFKGAAFSRTVSITKEDQDMIIVLNFEQGGERI